MKYHIELRSLLQFVPLCMNFHTELWNLTHEGYFCMIFRLHPTDHGWLTMKELIDPFTGESVKKGK